MKAEIILRGKPVLVAEKLAAALVKAKKATYPQKAMEPESKEPETQKSEQAAAPKKRAYSRKDMVAE
jgi:hypothetical protein